MGTLNFILILVAICVAPLDAFDLFKKDHLIPSDGFHDVLGLVPFWLSEGFPDQGLKRTLGTKRDNLPTSWETLTSQSTGTKTYTIQGRCSLDGKFAVENAVLENKKVGNCENPSLKMVFDKIFPSIDVMKTTQQLINPDSFFFEKLEINRGTKEVTVEAKAKDSWRLLSGDNFVLGGASLTLGFKAGEPVDGINSWKIKAEGTVGVSAHSLKMVIDKPKNEASLPFQWKIDSLLMVDLMGIFGITMSQLNFLAIGLDTGKLEGLTFENPDCNGQIDLIKDPTQRTSETFQIVCKASISNSAAFRAGDVYLIMTRAAGQVVRPAIVIDVADTINIQETLENFISEGAFISDFAMLGRIERNCIIMIAKDEIVMVENKKLMDVVKPFITEYDTKMIPEGVHVRVMIPLKANMQSQKDCKENLPAEVPDQLAVTIKITTGGLSFSFPEQFKSDMPKFLKCLDPQIKAELPRQLFPPSAGPIDIKEITIGQGRSFKITVVLKGPFVFMGGKIKVNDLEVTITKQKSDDLHIAGVTTITVGKLAVGLTLEKQGNKYALSAYVESFKLDQLQEMIGPNTLLEFISLLGNLKDFGIKEFKLVKKFGKGEEHKSLRIAGKPILWGWENCYIEGLIWKPRKGTDQPTTAVAVGIVIEGIRLDKIMERIFGSNLFSVAWFSEMTALIIVSNANGEVETSSDKKGKANDVGDAQKGKSDAPSTENSAPGKRSDIREADEFYPVFERSRRNLGPHFAYLRNIRKKQGKRVRPIFEPNTGEVYGRNHVHKKNRRLEVENRALLKRAGTKPKPESKGSDDSKKTDEEGKEEEEEKEDVVKFNVPYLSSRDIEKGLTFVGIFNIPQDNGCFGDSLCLWLAEKVGKDATIEISGTISKSGFKFGAKFSGTIPVNEDGSLALQSIALELELSGKKSSVKLECTLYWNIPENLGSGHVQFIGSFICLIFLGTTWP
ncbi:uncharacterized protein LOC135683868 [Rhopilema esculentum]|uniref:uncharacterized protein LOC135683868 n=1 Tax=Rhopilema esculentum TaxID=499914 RepID=UPI0031CF72C6